MALRLLLCRNKWNTKKADILLGSISHQLCHSSPSPTTTATTLGPHVPVPVPERSLTNDYGGVSLYPNISPELYIQLRHCLLNLGPRGAVRVPDAHKNDRMIFLAQFAVFMINDTNTRRDDSKRLGFVRVVSAMEQQFDEPIYYIFLEAASFDDDDGRVTKFYWAKFRIRRICLELMSWCELESPPTTTQSSLD